MSWIFDKFFPSFDKNQTKVYLKSAVIRMKFQKTKKIEGVKREKLNIIDLVKQGKDELARIRIEYIIQDENLIQVYELLELFCEKLHARMDLLAMEKHCPKDLQETVYTVAFAAPHLQIEELMKVREQLGFKYGPEFLEHLRCHSELVNTMVQEKVKIQKPDEYLVSRYFNQVVGTNFMPPPNPGPAPPPPPSSDFHFPPPPTQPYVPPPGGSGGGGGYYAPPPVAPQQQQYTFPNPPPYSEQPPSGATPPVYAPHPSYYSPNPSFPPPPSTTTTSTTTPSSANKGTVRGRPSDETFTFPEIPTTKKEQFTAGPSKKGGEDELVLPSVPTTTHDDEVPFSFPSVPGSTRTTSNDSSSTASDDQPSDPKFDLDDLTARFEALKKNNGTK